MVVIDWERRWRNSFILEQSIMLKIAIFWNGVSSTMYLSRGRINLLTIHCRRRRGRCLNHPLPPAGSVRRVLELLVLDCWLPSGRLGLLLRLEGWNQCITVHGTPNRRWPHMAGSWSVLFHMGSLCLLSFEVAPVLGQGGHKLPNITQCSLAQGHGPTCPPKASPYVVRLRLEPAVV
jgi:hypothetical protein